MTEHLLACIIDDGSLAVVKIDADGDGPGEASAPITLASSLDLGLTFNWPCWAPDGRSLLVSASGHSEDGQPRVEVWRLIPGSDAAPDTVFENRENEAQIIAPNIPHYLSWSRREGLAAVVAQSGQGLTLFLVDAEQRRAPRALSSGAPLFFAWSPDGQALAIHQGVELLLFDLEADAEDDARRLLRDRPTFRAPVWTHDGSAVLYTAPSSSDDTILWRSPRDGSARDVLARLAGPVALVGSPRDDRVALVSIGDGDGAGRDLRILDVATGKIETLHTGPVSAVQWAPTGEALFMVRQIGGDPTLQLQRIDMESGEVRPIARFRPSNEFATLLAFFDQYAQSHSLVSADGRWLTFAGLASNNGGSGRRGLSPQNGCYLVPSDGSSAPRRVAAGNISFFAPATPQSAPGGDS